MIILTLPASLMKIARRPPRSRLRDTAAPAEMTDTPFDRYGPLSSFFSRERASADGLFRLSPS
jgi:hypothetical protein